MRYDDDDDDVLSRRHLGLSAQELDEFPAEEVLSGEDVFGGPRRQVLAGRWRISRA